jgi:pimeloyl-ACP methyl ester carboxylesterase
LDNNEISSLLTFYVLTVDLEAIRHTLGIECVSILGHSILGTLAIEYARRCPENVSHVIAVGTPPKGDMDLTPSGLIPGSPLTRSGAWTAILEWAAQCTERNARVSLFRNSSDSVHFRIHLCSPGNSRMESERSATARRHCL